MDQSALWSGLAGAVVGSLTSIGTMVVQNLFSARRDFQKLIVDTAFRDYELRFHAAAEHDRGTMALFPLPVMLVYHQTMIDLAKTGRLTPDSAREIYRKMVEMRDSLAKAHEDYEAAQRRRPGA